MIDIHCHILPNVDDGSPHAAGFIEMAKNAVDAGITHIFATPHHLNGQFINPKSKILKLVDENNKKLQQEGIPLIIHPGQELRIHHDIFLSIERNEILTFDNSGKYLLLELPSKEVPTYTRGIIYELLLKGIIPIIAHPERNKGFIETPNLLYELVCEGALTQLTSGSIAGHFGNKIKSFSEKIIDNRLVHFIASDAHNTRTRGFSLLQAYDKVTKSYGIHQTFYFKENTELLLNGLTIQKEDPLPFRKKILGIF
ncbi:tyrosine-protein phosphatase [Heyndrickxia oleronia]|jgi:protein-tyrosine phosphatase|uniref:tyrosine-protein phosphatase n=1 Tax=Heyndrickxia oleronia TaxID=38875 RepID=UPI00242A5968|nr:CpsB/CapC family capsule biosynthesis tyrosine phosphatase [Heyndrickxia oleronia]MCI1590676.1 tyrosine protein phosphatase [Heyndrickxia oleronia]MCI1612135.1 tyrosine protein phosphatase [Heyndrickxia oleronia]MCI1759844.1 tyrosine protein phosphatase [Heyndrickxia oleronia]